MLKTWLHDPRVPINLVRLLEDSKMKEIDEIIQKKLEKYGNMMPKDMDLPNGMILDTTLKMISNLIKKMENKYKTPKEKVICVVNSSKLVSGENLPSNYP